MKHSNKKNKSLVFWRFCDQYFVLAIVALMVIGLLMMTSASMAISERVFHQPFHYVFRQGAYMALGVLLAIIVLRVQIRFWLKHAYEILGISILLLLVVMIPGIGHTVNGSSRWITLGPIGMQVSEIAKLAVIIYFSKYLAKHYRLYQENVFELAKPLIFIGVIGVLLLMEPDFGATAVIMVTVLGMLFLAGVRLWVFALLFIGVLLALALLAVVSPYRLVRLTTFLNPWANQYDSGYQLTQSLIAFGRGGLFGVGLGGSIQKLFYLPEAHTDFLFAVLAEEVGLVGVGAVILLYGILVWRAFLIGKRAQRASFHEAGLMSYGFSLWIGIQAIVNMGVNAGLFPTKGLTLPLLSYGGSSMIIICIVLALLLRIDFETRAATLPDEDRYGFSKYGR